MLTSPVPPVHNALCRPTSFGWRQTRIVSLLTILSVVVTPRPSPAQDTITFRHSVSGAVTTYDIPASTGARDGVSWQITNPGDVIATRVRWARQGQDWTSVDAIVAGLIPTGATDEQKARLIWDFVRTSVYHWWPGTLGLDPHDPVTLLNGYGYGFCDDMTAALGALAAAAGMPSRFWILGDGEHTFPELFYAGQWHVYDPDLLTLVLERDNRTVAGVDDMMADPGLLDRAGPELAAVKEYLSRTRPTSYYDAVHGYRTGHEISWTLRPRETVTLEWSPPDRALVQSGALAFVPPSIARGRYATVVDVGDQAAREAMHSFSGLEVAEIDGDAALVAAGSANAGEFVVAQRIPYPLLASGLTLEGAAPDDSTIRVLASWEGPRKTWDWWTLAQGVYRSHPAFEAEGAVALYGSDWNFPAVHGVAPGITSWLNFDVKKASDHGGKVRIGGSFYRHLPADDVRLYVSIDGTTWVHQWTQATTGLVDVDLDITALVAGVSEFKVKIEFTPGVEFWTAGFNELRFEGVEPETYTEVAAATGIDDLDGWQVDLAPLAHGCDVTPCYDLYVKVRLEGSATARPHVRDVTLVSGFQVARASLPSYDTGVASYSVSQDSDATLDVTHVWQEFVDRTVPTIAGGPVRPAPGATVSLDEPLWLEWPTVTSPVGAGQYRIQVCADAICTSPLVAGLEHDSNSYVGPGVNGIRGDSDDRYYIGQGTKWLVPYRQLLQPGQTYYWRVRAQDIDGRWGPWSATWSFVTSPDRASGIAMTLTSNGGASYFEVGQGGLELRGNTTSTIPIARVEWVSDTGERGYATGTTEWSVPGVPLHPGTNVIAVTTTDANGLRSTIDVQAIVRSLTYTLAEGATGPFTLDLSLANASDREARIAITYLLPTGAPVVDRRTLPALSRTSIRVNDLPGLADTSVSTLIESLDTLPLAIERTMTWGGGEGGHLAGAGQPNTSWYFAEGAQGYFDTYLLLANTGPIDAVVDVQFLTEQGDVVTARRTVRAQSRQTVFAGDIPQLVGKSFGIVVTSSRPIMTERAMYFGSGGRWAGGHDSPGVSSPASHWYFAEGATGPMFDTYFLVANPSATAATLRVSYFLANGTTIEHLHVLPPQTRLTINAETQDPRLADAAFSMEVAADVGVIAERSMYWAGEWYQWHEAHNAFGLTAPALRWMMAEGQVGGQRATATYVLIGNPDRTRETPVRVTLLRENGLAPVSREFTVGAASRFNVDVAHVFTEIGDGERFGAVVESLSDVAVMVEHSLYSDAAGVFWAAGVNATAAPIPR